MPKTLREFVKLPPARRRLVLRAALLVIGFRGALALLPYRRVLRIAGAAAGGGHGDGAPSSGPGPAGGDVQAATVVWAVRAAGRRLLRRDPCLPQALAALVLLRRRGLEAELRLGVRREPDGSLRAHAWVERGDDVLVGGDVPLADYRRLSDSAPES